MIVYEKEKQLGLEEAILAHQKAFVSVKILENKKFNMEDYPQLAKACMKRQMVPADLFVFDNIQVSSGWNHNDDIFDKTELWGARNTIVHKPLNFNHERDIIIGHTIASYPVDTNYHLLTEDVPSESLPDLYHIYATDVIYTKTQNVEFDEYVQSLITQIKNGEWSVSMECRMKNFDYGLMDKNGRSMIMPRNEATAGYTQYLRIFGGSGEYAGYRIGRVFRDINFIGKGVVKVPANPHSIIFSENLFSAGNLGYITIDSLNDTKLEKQMDEKEVATLNSKITELENTVASLNSQLEASQNEVEAAKKEKKMMQEQCSKAETEVTELSAKLNSEEFKRIKKVGAKAERVDNLLKQLADEVILNLYNEASTFVDENADLEDDVYSRVVKHFLQARKSDAQVASLKKANDEQANASVDDDPDLEDDDSNVSVAKTVEAEEDNPYDIDPKILGEAAVAALRPYHKNVFKNFKGDK